MCAAAPKVLLFLVFLFIVDSAHAGSKGAGSKNAGSANQFPAVQGGGSGGGAGPGGAGSGSGGGANDDMVAGKVICNVISFVRAIGLPIMTGVILGSSIMAIFGRLAWPAIAILVVFTGVFFGADKLVRKFAEGVGPTSVFACT